MRKLIRQFISEHEALLEHRWLRPFAPLLRQHDLWYLQRRSVAGGVAVGLFCGLIPGPFQMLGAALCAIWLRVNLPVAMVTTLYSNPFTIVPLYALAYGLGAWISGANGGIAATNFYFPELHWDDWVEQLTAWLTALGKPLLIGLPVLAVILAVLGYVMVRVGWRIALTLHWRARKKRSVKKSD